MRVLPLRCKHSAEFHIHIQLRFEYGTFCMQGELSAPHQRVIIGSLWSTWWLRARCKQLSLQLLWIACRNKCLSRHLYQLSPLKSLYIPAYKGTGNGATVWAYLPSYCQSVERHRPVSRQDSGFLSVHSSINWKKLLKPPTCQVIAPLVTGPLSGYMCWTRQEKLTMVLDGIFLCVYMK